MDLYIINTNNKSADASKEGFMGVSADLFVINRFNGDIQDAFPLTYVKVEDSTKHISDVNIQHFAAIERMNNKNCGGVIALDSIRFTDPTSITNYIFPSNADVCVFSAPNLQIRGIYNNTDWVMFDGDDPMFNNICTAYYVSKEGARKLYARRNEIMGMNISMGHYLPTISHPLVTDRLMVYATKQPTVTKPRY